jgi:hypothetical protein
MFCLCFVSLWSPFDHSELKIFIGGTTLYKNHIIPLRISYLHLLLKALYRSDHDVHIEF